MTVFISLHVEGVGAVWHNTGAISPREKRSTKANIAILFFFCSSSSSLKGELENSDDDLNVAIPLYMLALFSCNM